MVELKYPNNKYREYIEFVSKYCENNNFSLILKGSLADNSAGEYSDIDLVIFGELNNKNIYEIIYHYNNPLIINISTNPIGMLIITYENEISVDLDIRKTLIEDDILTGNVILVNKNIDINESNLIVRYDLNVTDIYKNNSIELMEMLKLIIKGTNKYLSKKESEAKEFLIEIKEKFELYYGIKILEFNNDYKNDIQIIFKCLLSINKIDNNIQEYIKKIIGL